MERNLTLKRLRFKFLALGVIFKRNTTFYLNMFLKDQKVPFVTFKALLTYMSVAQYHFQTKLLTELL